VNEHQKRRRAMAQAPKKPVLQKCGHRKCIHGTHRVVIYKEGCSYRVEPGRVVVHPGATVNFVSLVPSHGGVDLWFPKGTHQTGTVHLDYLDSKPVQVGKAYGVFAYSVHVPGADGGGFAEGGSPPRMIVADP
jgi:hypothetical protein